MAFAHVGDIGTALSTVGSQTSLVMTTSATLEAGNVCVLIIAVDNVSGSDGDDAAVASVADSASNIWTKAIQFANAQTGQGAGACSSIWFTRARTQLNSGGTITATFTGSSIGASGMSAKEYTMSASKRLALVATNTLANDGAAAGSLNATTPNVSCLRVRGIASESNSTTVLTNTASWAIFTQAISGAGTSATEMGVRGEWIISTGTGSASAPTAGAGAVDNASTYAAFIEADYQDWDNLESNTFVRKLTFYAQAPVFKGDDGIAAPMVVEAPFTFRLSDTETEILRPPQKQFSALRNRIYFGIPAAAASAATPLVYTRFTTFKRPTRQTAAAILAGEDGIEAPFVPPVAAFNWSPDFDETFSRRKPNIVVKADFNIDARF